VLPTLITGKAATRSIGARNNDEVAAQALEVRQALSRSGSRGLCGLGRCPDRGLVADLWGRRNLGFLFGLVYVGHQLGAFVGAWAGGLVFDRTGSFPVWAAPLP
jgi:hypothetical protein